jgi:hypothetical protein
MSSIEPRQQCEKLANYIERSSCAVSVLGEILETVPEEKLDEGRVQSLGFLLQIIGESMMQRSMDGYAYLNSSLDDKSLHAHSGVASQ